MSASRNLQVLLQHSSDMQPACRFGKAVAIASVGVHCLDKNSCYAPTNCSTPITTSPSAEGCSPSWWCCDWDSGSASLSGSITQGAIAVLLSCFLCQPFYLHAMNPNKCCLSGPPSLPLPVTPLPAATSQPPLALQPASQECAISTMT